MDGPGLLVGWVGGLCATSEREEIEEKGEKRRGKREKKE